MRSTADVRYTYTSWQTAYPGHAVDLTELEFPPVRYDDGVDAALQLLDLGPSPSSEVVADLRDDLREGLYAAEDLECAYAAVLYPEPERTAEHVWVGFSVFDNRDEPVAPAEALADEVADRARHEAVSGRVKDLDLPDGPAASLFQTDVQSQPRLTVCGTACAAGLRYVIRGNATNAALVGVLDDVVMAWARDVSFAVPLLRSPMVVTAPAAAPARV